MSDERLIRLENLRDLKQQKGWGPVDFAREFGRRVSYWSDVLRADTSNKSFGEKVARSVEEKLGLPRHALDNPDCFRRSHAAVGTAHRLEERGPTYGVDHSLSHPAAEDAPTESIEDAFRAGRGWSGKDGLEMLSPQEVELVGIFRQLGAAARKVTLESLRSTRDHEEREAEALQERLRGKTPAHKPRRTPTT